MTIVGNFRAARIFFVNISLAGMFFLVLRPPLHPYNFSNGPSLSQKETNIDTDYNYSQKKHSYYFTRIPTSILVLA